MHYTHIYALNRCMYIVPSMYYYWTRILEVEQFHAFNFSVPVLLQRLPRFEISEWFLSTDEGLFIMQTNQSFDIFFFVLEWNPQQIWSRIPHVSQAFKLSSSTSFCPHLKSIKIHLRHILHTAGELQYILLVVDLLPRIINNEGCHSRYRSSRIPPELRKQQPMISEMGTETRPRTMLGKPAHSVN